MQVETLNPYYDPKKSTVANLKAWRRALESKTTARGPYRLVNRIRALFRCPLRHLSARAD